MTDKTDDKPEDRMDAMVDKVLKCIDGLNARMDAMEMADKARRDSEDEKARKDADEAEAKRKAETEAVDKKDGLEDGKKPGEPTEVAADRARKDEEDEKARKDTEDKARADAEIRNRIDAVEKALPKQLSDADYAAMADAQARADAVFQAFGDSAPRPLQGEDLMALRRRYAKKLQPHSPRAKDVKLDLIHDEHGFKVFEDMIYHDAQQAALAPADLAVGELRPITRNDPHTGLRTTTFVGRGTFIGAMKRPAMRARLNLERRG